MLGRPAASPNAVCRGRELTLSEVSCEQKVVDEVRELGRDFGRNGDVGQALLRRREQKRMEEEGAKGAPPQGKRAPPIRREGPKDPARVCLRVCWAVMLFIRPVHPFFSCAFYLEGAPALCMLCVSLLCLTAWLGLFPRSHGGCATHPSLVRCVGEPRPQT